LFVWGKQIVKSTGMTKTENKYKSLSAKNSSHKKINLCYYITTLFNFHSIAPRKLKSPLQSQIHFSGFGKTTLVIPKLTKMVFVSYKAKTNKLNRLPKRNGVFQTFFARMHFALKSAPQAYGFFIDDT
jgi:hypothetical protein